MNKTRNSYATERAARKRKAWRADVIGTAGDVALLLVCAIGGAVALALCGLLIAMILDPATAMSWLFGGAK